MKLDHVHSALKLSADRYQLLQQLGKAREGAFNVSMNSSYLDQRMVEVTIPAVVAEFERRIVAVEQQLRDLGVEID